MYRINKYIHKCDKNINNKGVMFENKTFLINSQTNCMHTHMSGISDK